MRKCTTQNCDKPYHVNGFCKLCYDRSPERVAYKKQYNASPSRKEYTAEYTKSTKFYKTRKDYSKTEVYKRTQLRYKSSTQDRFKEGIRAAARRNIEWSLSYEDFVNLLDAHCYYCQGPLNPLGSGIDRVDNLAGYVKQNCVSCCSLCNKLKSNLLSSDETSKVAALLKQLRGGKLWSID